MTKHGRRDPARIEQAGENVPTRGEGLARRLVLVAALALVFAVADGGASASAAVADLEGVIAESPSSSSNKGVTATCPSGKQVTGAGGRIVGGGGQVGIGLIRPDAGLGSVTVQGREDENGHAASWSVQAVAVCATPPLGLQRVSASSAKTSSNKAVTASCPSGKRLLGTGAEISGGRGQATPNDILPGSSLKGVTVRGLEDENGTTVDWQVRAYAICASPVAGLERVVAASANNSSGKSVAATCPSGKRSVGAGAELGGGGGEVVLDGVVPTGSLDGVLAIGVEDEDGTSANWLVRSFAICAAASQRVVATTSSSSTAKGAFADCPAGTQPTGLGGDITGGGGQVLLQVLQPVGEQGFAFADEDENGYAGSWFLRAYAICTTSLPGQTVSVNSTASDSVNVKGVNVPCLNGGRVVGGGGFIDDGGTGEVVLDEVRPNAALTSVTASGLEDETGYAGNWRVTVFAICAQPPGGLELVSVSGDPDSDPASVTATCPGGKNLLGTGAEIDGGLGQVVLDDVRPNSALTTVTVTGLEDETGFSNNWSLRAYAICANP